MITSDSTRRPVLWNATRLLALWIIVLLISIPEIQADIYFWRDAQGIIHFSNQDAPPDADLYMKEPDLPPVSQSREVAGQQTQPAADADAIRRQMKTESELEQANRKLDEALDRVDQLAREVQQTRAEAQAATKAAEIAVNEAAKETDKRHGAVVVYPRYRHRKKAIPHKYAPPTYFRPDTSRYPYYHFGEKRHRSEIHRPPGPTHSRNLRPTRHTSIRPKVRNAR